MASVTKQEMVEAFKMMTRCSSKYICSKRYTKEITINWNSSVQKRAILKRLYPEEDFTSTAKTILSKMADRLDNYQS
jgi:hypothetical protein